MSTSDPAVESFPIFIKRPNEDLAVEISDAFDRLVAAPLSLREEPRPGLQDTSWGEKIKVMLPRGLYTIRSTLGGEQTEQLIRVNGEREITALVPPRVTSAAYQGAESSHEYYTYPANDCSKHPTTESLGDKLAADSSLFLFLRAGDRKSYAASGGGLEGAAQNLHLETPEGQVVTLALHSKIHGDGWLGFSAQAPAGDYRLHDLGGAPRTTLLALYPGWQTQLFLSFDGQLVYGTQRVFLARPDRGFLPDDDWARAADLGLSVLVSGRGAVPGKVRRIMLGDKFENPMLGLIAAWVVLRDFSSRRELSEDVLHNLDGLLPDSPDVAALRVAYARRYRKSVPLQPIRRTPMLQAAVGELIRAAAEHPEIIHDESDLDAVSPRLYADSAFTSWRPVNSELPDSLRITRSKESLMMRLDRSLLARISDSSPTRFRSTTLPESLEPAAVERDPDAWFQAAVADEMELHARHRAERASSTSVDVSKLAKRTGVTPRAVRKVLETAPLKSLQVAISLSNPPAVDDPEADTVNLLVETTVELARTLISSGASLAYGGDFRRHGYTRLLAELIRAYNETATRPAQYLHSFLAAKIPRNDAPEDMPLIVHHLVDSPEVACDAIMPPSSDTETHPSALYYSDMRRVMAKHTAARIALGGSSEPRKVDGGQGYGGRYPGIVEEAWRTLEAQKPLYVAGGFGGASELVADLLEGKETSPLLQDETWASDPYFRDKADAIDADPYHTALGLPQRMEDLADRVRELSRPLLATDAASVAWNGLSIEENLELFRLRDPVLVTWLVLKGLLAMVDADFPDR